MIGELFSGHDFLWTCAWQSTACVVAGLLLSFALRRRPARAHQVLLLAMVAAVAVPTMSVLVRHLDLGLLSAQPVAVEREKESILPISTTVVPEMSALSATEYVPEPVELVEWSPTTVAAAAERAEIPWISILFCAWITASLVLMARLALTFVRGIRLLRRAMPLDSASIREAARIAKAKLRVTKDMSVRGSESISSPVIWCWASRPVFLVPSDDVQTGDSTDWVSVLCHELAHYKRGDHISGLLAELAVCILPWNALLWWAKARLVRLSEEACDDWVVATGRPGPDYAKLLLDLLPQVRMAFVPTVVGSKKELQARVRRLVHGRCGNPRAGSRWAWIVTIVAVCLALGTALAQERRPGRDQPDDDVAEARMPGEFDEAELHDREPTEREQLERETRLLREQEEIERTQRERQVIRAELTRHRQALLELIDSIERELGGLRDDQDEEARKLQANLRGMRGELRRVEAELGGIEREPGNVPPRESREAELRSRELLAEREALQKRLHELELALERLPDDRDEQAREIQAELQEIREHIRRVEDQLRAVQLPRRERADWDRAQTDARMRELAEHRRELQERAREIERELREHPDVPDAQQLRAKLREITQQIQNIERELRATEQARRERALRDRPELAARVRELTERREQLEEKAHQIERMLEEDPDAPDASELQAELRGIREQMRRVETELGYAERGRLAPGPQVRELMEHREQVQRKARDIERKLAEQPDSPEAQELQAQLRANREALRLVDRELAELQRPPREPAERERPEAQAAKYYELRPRRLDLETRAAQLERELREARGREDARQLEMELDEIHQQIEQIDREAGRIIQPTRRPVEVGRPGPEARRAELLRERDTLIQRGQEIKRELDATRDGDARERLKDELADIRNRLGAVEHLLSIEDYWRALGPLGKEARYAEPEQLQRQVEELRGEVMRLHDEMQHMRELLQQLLERPRPERERGLDTLYDRERRPERERRPDPEPRERHPEPGPFDAEGGHERERPREGETTEQADPAIY